MGQPRSAVHAFRTTTASRTGSARGTNQDRVAVRARRVVLADGMGGRCGGEVAAQLAVDAVLDRDAGDLRGAVARADRRIRAHARAHELAGMGTTVVAVDQPDPEVPNVVVAWVGDSRLYRVRDGEAWQATCDHTWEALLLDLGTDPAEAAGRRHVLTRAVGTQPPVEVDLCTFEARVGDIFVLCSDGVHGALTGEEVARLAPGGALALVDAAVAAGTRDDATAAVVRVVPAAVDADTGQLAVLTGAG